MSAAVTSNILLTTNGSDNIQREESVILHNQSCEQSCDNNSESRQKDSAKENSFLENSLDHPATANTSSSTSGFFDSFRSFVTSRPTTPPKKEHKKKTRSTSPQKGGNLSTDSAGSGISEGHDSTDDGRRSASTAADSSGRSSGPSDTEDAPGGKGPSQPGDIVACKIEQERHFKHRRAKALCTDKSANILKKGEEKCENQEVSDTSSSASESHRVKRKRHSRHRKDFKKSPDHHANNVRHSRNNSETQSDVTEESTASKKDEEKKRVKPCNPSQEAPPVRKRGRPRLSDALRYKVTNPFLQNSNCYEVAPKLAKCRECRIAAYKHKKMQNSYCRFLAYRKLCYGKNGTILNSGFSQPSDATEEHMKIWLPSVDAPPIDLNIETSKAILAHVGDQFCDLVEQEKEALSLHIGKDKTITWKRLVQGVREMCDVCSTTIFNIHWVCHKCGLAVCIDCYKGRKQGIVREDEDAQKDRDEYQWLLCNGRQPHDLEKLMLTQIIAGSALWDVSKTLHDIRKLWKIPSYCKCTPKDDTISGNKPYSNGICKQLMSAVSKCFNTDKALHSNSYLHKPPRTASNGISGLTKNSADFMELNYEINDRSLRWLADVALKDSESGGNLDRTGLQLHSNSYNCNDGFGSLRNLLLRTPENKDNGTVAHKKSFSSSIDDVIECFEQEEFGKKRENEAKVNCFSRRYPQPQSGRDPLPIRICTLAESTLLHPDVPHSWLCNGRLLLLHEPHNNKNLDLFQEQWKRGQPILVGNVSERLDMSLWHPDGFCRDFGNKINDLVNCKTGAVLQDLPMRKFWEGFENFSNRMKDEHGEYMLLKLKDWPPGDDFSEMLPQRFQDLMRGLPLPQYTHRNGILNLAGRLPACFVRPDLGPKMYNAYGSALYPSKGTTNLHLDISDAVNVMVYVGIPHDGKDEDHIQEALKAIDEGGCDSLMRMRVRERGVRPGALWHIYNARDADKIRELLNKVAVERGEKLEAYHDPIHDQSWYVDEELQERLYQEYGVEGYAIAQCLGDAVFIPAGAPHQVRNLHSCVKVAEDFVSPENIAHCFKLTQEFRNLSDTHTNHEDKLQIKNIIYHVVRDALAHLIVATPGHAS